MNSLEEQRRANIQRNKDHLKELGILYSAPTATARNGPTNPPAKRRKLESQPPPSRSSARIASAPERPSYAEDEGPSSAPPRKKPASKPAPPRTSKNARAKIDSEGPALAHAPVNGGIEGIRAGWASWKPIGSPPTRDGNGTFHFEEHPSFRPNKSPEEMLREGCFGGSYFRPLYSRRLGVTVRDDYLELPGAWIAGLDAERVLTGKGYDAEVNKYGVKCGQSIEEWEDAGWINHEYDVRGWFQWYCRFFAGRRCEDDERQVGRWRKCVGETGRWRRMLLKKYVAMGVREVFDDGEQEEQNDVSPVMHQTCHHWAYEVRQGDLERFWTTGR